MTLPAPLFQYGLLPRAHCQYVIGKTGAIRDHLRRANEGIAAAGRDLALVRDRIPSRMFGDWLEAEFALSRRSAYRLMAVAEAFDGCANLARMAPSALYLLAEPSTPKEARAAALALAGDGGYVTHAHARALVRQTAGVQHRSGRFLARPVVAGATRFGGSFGTEGEARAAVGRVGEFEDKLADLVIAVRLGDPRACRLTGEALDLHAGLAPAERQAVARGRQPAGKTADAP